DEPRLRDGPPRIPRAWKRPLPSADRSPARPIPGSPKLAPRSAAGRGLRQAPENRDDNGSRSSTLNLQPLSPSRDHAQTTLWEPLLLVAFQRHLVGARQGA